MFSKFFIERPVFACVISILILIMGAVAYFGLPVEQYPDLAPPIVRVEAFYPGADAQTVASTIAAPIEQEVNGVDHMIYMNSVSSDGRYQLDITFESGVDVDLSAVLVQNRVKIAEPKLPEEARRLGINTKKQSTAMVGVISMWSDAGEYDDLFISNYLTINVKDEISRIYGVGGTLVFPTKDYGMRIWLDPEKLKARKLTVDDVKAAIASQNVQVAAGSIGRQPAPPGADFEFIVNTKGRLTDPAEFGEIIVKAEDKRVVKVKDIARVELGARDYGTIATFNGRKSGVLVVYQLPGANLVEVSRKVEHKLDALRRDFPPGLQAEYFYDSAMFIDAALHEVQKTLLEAFVLVFIVVLVFLQNLRATLIPALTIPVSLIGAMFFLYLFGFSINMLTMFGVVLAIGIVVDDAIVVVENVERNMAEHKLPPHEATVRAMGEITGPVIAITLVLMAVFVPTAALPGLTGEMYRQFALTIAASTGLSAVCALTLAPALCALLLSAHDPKHKRSVLLRPLRWAADAFNGVFGGIVSAYGDLARLAAKAALISLVLFGGVLYFTYESFVRVPGGFVPEEDLGFVMINAQLPDGASLERTQAVVDRMSQIARDTDGVKGTVCLGGFSVIDGMGSNFGAGWIVLDPWDERTKTGRSTAAIVGDLTQKLASIQDAQFMAFGLPAISGLGMTSGFDMRILNKAPATYSREDQQNLVYQLIGHAMGQARGGQGKLLAAFSGFRAGVPQLYLDIDREKVMQLDIPLQSVFQTLQTALGSTYVNDFNLFNRTFQVNVQADANFRLTPTDILRLEVRNARGQMVPVSTFTTVQQTIGPDRVTRYNLYPSATLNGIPRPGVSSGEVLAMMDGIAHDVLPPGMGFEWTGMSFQEKQIGGQAIIVFALGLLVVYLILAAQYESWSTPLAVVLSVPLVVIGAMGALMFRGLDNNVFTQIGLVLLVGLGAKNAILIVEFARENRAKGMGIVDSAIHAATLRFRPIVMTSLAFILGVVPLLVASGAGAASRQALGSAVFGGMISNTVLGLLFTPTLYVVIQWLSELVTPKRRKAHAPTHA